MIFVVVKAAVQRASVWMYDRERNAASGEDTKAQTCPFEGWETSDLFLPHVPHATFPRQSLVLVPGFEQQNPV